MSSYSLISPKEVSQQLALKIKELRLQQNWTQEILAMRAGVSLGSLRRFEQTGQIALDSLLLLAITLGRLDDFTKILEPPPARSIEELERRELPQRKRASK